MSTRAEKFTTINKIPDLFSDFLTSFDPHPITGDISRIKNEQSIKQSLKNLIFTNYEERPFQSQIGSSIRASLFEPNDETTQEDLRLHIEQTININEPRVSLIDLSVKPIYEQDKVFVGITFLIINTQQIQTLDLILRRVR